MSTVKWWPACALVVLSGCSSGPAPRTFLLDPPLQGGNDRSPAADGPVVQVQIVTVPDYLDTEDIVTRDNAHELKASASGKWGERLSSGITDALTSALATRLPAYQVMPARPADRHARQIRVDVDAFDVWGDGRCALGASWTILEPGAAAVAPTRHEVFLTPAVKASAAGDAAVVAAMAATIDKLADALAHDIATQATLVSSEHP
jgi:uncharacterized lipoprotein YmbA